MADLKSKQIKFPLTGTSVVSSSAQIATDISGSFVADSGSFSTRITTDSGSFSTRVTTAESELSNTLISGSAQIATDISGSFVAPSASFSTRVTTAENVVSSSIISSSAQLSTDISGSFVAPSASFSTRVTTAETELGNTLFSGSAQVDHDSTTNFVANEHIDHSGVTLTAGDGLSGGGDITTNRSFAVDATVLRTNSGAISSSAQLSTDISGSFGAPSASFSTRITTAESELGNTILSSSAQISDDISGSLSVAAVAGLGAGIISGSSSNSSLTTAIVSEGANIVSASAQLSTDISGSFAAPSASISTRLTTTENVVSSSVISGSAQIDHDATTNFVANEHIDHSSVSVIAGTGMTGGGTIAANRTLNVIGGTGVTANANDIAIGQDVATTANVQFNHISASGNISSSRGSLLGFDSGSFNINLGVGTTTPAESLEVVGAISASTSGSFLNIDAPHIKSTNIHGTILTATQGTIDHDSLANFVANEHIDHSGVTITAGAGLTGGGTIASTRTLAVGAGTGVTVNANDVAIGQAVATDSDVEFASVTTTGNITAQGDVIAQNYIVSSSVTHMTSSIRSGSTVSGDTPADDTHQFTGSLSISGSTIDITNTMTASLASIFLQNNGHFSSSLGTIKGFSAIDGTTITGTTFTGVSGSFSENLGVNTTTPAEALEVVGSVSASASGSFLNVDITDNLGVTGKFTLPNITDVSASIASAVAGGDDMGNHTATQDLDMDGNDIFDVQHISGSGNISGSLGNILGYKSGSFQQLDANVVSASSVQATNLTGLVGTATQGTINHDSLAGFVANEHIDHTTITLTAGDGLSGGGTIASNRSFAVDATVLRTTGDSVISSSAQLADDISGSFSTAAVVGLGAGIISGSSSNSSLTTAIVGEGAGILSGSAQIAADVSGSLSAAAIVGLGAGVISASAMVDHDSTTNFVANEHIDHSSVSVVAGTGLTGGGTIAANRTLNVVGGTGVTANANDIAIGQDVATIANVLFAEISASGDFSSSLSGSFLNVNVTSNLEANVASIAGKLYVDDIHGVTNDTNRLSLDDDTQAGIANGVSLTGLNHIYICADESNNGTGAIKFRKGTDNDLDSGTAVQLAEISNAGDLTIEQGSLFISGSEKVYFGAGSHTYISEDINDRLRFFTGGEEFMRFTEDSSDTINLYKDTTFASSASMESLEITGEAGHISGSQSTLKGFKQANITSGSFDYINATGLMTASGLETSGDIVAFGSSDRELKDNIQSIENPLEKMEKIGGYTFVWNDKQNVYKGKDIGVVAQEIQSVLPEIVATRANGYLGVKYEKIVPLLIESIKELKKEVEDIKQKCDCLNK